jgi:LPXTG-motif cell wall-anchored protein
VIATTTAVSAAAPPKRLPNTGVDMFGHTVAGLALLAAGAGALLVVRRRKATS